MTEKSILITIDDISSFYGVKENNLSLLKKKFPKLKIVARGDIIKVAGEDALIAEFENTLNLIFNYFNKYNTLSTDRFEQLINEKKDFKTIDIEEEDNSIILFGANGKPIRARTKNQKILCQTFNEKDLMFAIGPAGTGKTYTSIALAVKALKEMSIRRIILSRPAVEAGEKLGFLPGDLREKLDPYLQPLYDALLDMIPQKKLEKLAEEKIIQIAPLAYMRGRTLNDAFVILDEAQNASYTQLKMFLTRMGENSKFIVTGDITQIDLIKKSDSGLINIKSILNDIPDIAFIDFDKSDIIRHKIVNKIVEAYENAERK